ncbi:conjugal transfer protein MobC [Sphingobacterium sp.]|uniref:conjugal transfer protein MobC n=1 Tax=Sphingobacterium sp. TaxID=341027 RepID=UPI0031E2B829
MSTGENEQGLRKIMDMTRWIAIFILVLHFYYYLYGRFKVIGLSWPFVDKVLINIYKVGLFTSFHKSKLIALTFLCLSLIGVKGKKSENITVKTTLKYLIPGLITYFIGYVLFLIPCPSDIAAILYIVITVIGVMLFITGGTYASRIIMDSLADDIFNEANETFPQEERLIQNEHSINLPAKYKLKGKVRNSYINIINPYRGVLNLGTPGAGKSYFFMRHVITQHIKKGFTMFVYDFKMPDLSVIAYNTWLKNKDKYPAQSECYFINFDDLSRSHRCNPLDPIGIVDITDAAESARTILLGLNKSWISKQGDFFIESPINFLTALIWFMRKYQDGAYCTLPHVLELMQVEYDELFPLLATQPEIQILINPFQTAYKNGAMEQLEGQIASAKIALARLSSPQLYYVLSGNDFTLNINDPAAPKVVCMGNNPQKIKTYGAVLSLYVNRLIKIVNQKDKLKSSLLFDEFPTIYLSDIDSLIATARSNKVATFLAIQDITQLRKDYGKEQADVIMGIVGNIISGQVTGDTAKLLSDRIGRIMQDRQSLSINRNDTSISKSKQLEAAVPASRISALSSGEFVGTVADNPEERIELKSFHCSIQNDHTAIKAETEAYLPIPIIRKIDPVIVQRNYQAIRDEVREIVNAELQRII